MTYATLMVHLELGRSNAQLLQLAGDLAERCRAGVLGVAACPPVQIVGGEGYFSAESFEQDRTELAKEMKEAEAQFRDALRTRATALEWRSTTDYASLSDYLAREARSADLVITGIASGDQFDASRALNTSDLVMQAGRPVLLVPAVVDRLKLERVVVGWKDTRETRRAISDALPLLKAATDVTVVEIASEQGLAAARAHLEDVVGWLKRHGVESTPMVTPSSRDDATELYAIARDNGADVIVAGAYGHSRLREWALGGVTRDLLLRADRCTLLSH
ncbi:MAG: universal stress protein [Burkholderiales bacterium]|nr:universal stress protein [Burkholderiales bacterium]